MYKNDTDWGIKNELKITVNDNGRAENMVQVTRMTGLRQPFKIEG